VALVERWQTSAVSWDDLAKPIGSEGYRGKLTFALVAKLAENVALLDAATASVTVMRMGDVSATNDRRAMRRMTGLVGIGGIMLGVLIGAGGGKLLLAPADPVALPERPARAPARAMVLRDADRIVIPEGSPYRSRIQVAEVRSTTTTPRRVLPAMVEADPARTVNVLPPLGGRIVSLAVRLGDEVEAGQRLMTIDSGDLAQAYADDDKATAQVELTRRALERARAILKAGGGAVKDVESAQNDFAQAEAENKRTRARLKALGGLGGLNGTREMIVRAPIAGTVTALASAPGAYINDATAPLLTLSNLETLWVTANVPESDTAFVAKGQAVDVTFPAYPGETFHGTVAFVGALLEPDTRRTKVRIAFANADRRLKPNMFAAATFIGQQATTLRVPTAALLMNNDSTTVFAEIAPWTFTRRTVVLGADQDEMAPVLSGLKPGARIVVRGGVLLND
jgi:cobalt-zinc-cadmium efflux system membrane fusion protein